MPHVTVFLQGIRIHVGFYCDGRSWRIDEADIYVPDQHGEPVCVIGEIDLLGGLGPAGQFQSLRALAEAEANDDAVATWNRDQRRQERETERVD
ncbi:MAG: hypothetical protein ABWY00_00875 [Dongiaceae bacterium]